MSDRDLKLPHTAVQALPGLIVRCRHCGRPLRLPESRWTRLGEHCATNSDRARTYTIPQDALPGT